MLNVNAKNLGKVAILSFEGEAEGIRTEVIVQEIIEKMAFAGYAVA